jgi:RecA/RadA recombinase
VEKSLSKEYGGVILQKMNDRVGQPLPSYPTGLVSFDEELFGCGGCPKGRIIEIFGPEASGKTTIALHIAAEVQKAGGMAALIDAEHSLNPNHAVDIGVDLNELLISQPDYGEQALEIVEALVRARAVDVIVVDSVAALVPKAELDGDMGDSVTFETPVYIRQKGSKLVDLKQVGDLHRKAQTGWYKKTKNLEILTHEGWQPLLGVQKKLNICKKKIVYTRTTSGYVGTTEDHSLFVNGKEVSPKELKIWDRLDTVNLPDFGKSELCSPELAWLLGFYVAEGTTPRTKFCNTFEVCNTDPQLISRCQTLIQELFGTQSNVRIQSRVGVQKDLHVLTVEANNVLGFFMQSCISDSLTKQVPVFVLNSNPKTKAAFVNGFWHGDGNHSSGGVRKFFNNSLLVVAGIQTMLSQTTVVVNNSRPQQITLTESKSTTHPAEVRQFYEGEPPEYLYDLSTKAGTFATLGGIVCHNSHMGLQARLMSQALRKLTGLCNTNGVTIIFINQIREKLGVQFGDPETTTGGRALKFYSSVRIKIRQLSRADGGIIEEDGVRVGQRSRLQAVKNKCGTPYSQTDLTLTYGRGWDKKADMIDYAIKLGVVTSGAWYIFAGEKYRRKDLTDEPVFGILSLAVKKAIEDRRVEREKAKES